MSFKSLIYKVAVVIFISQALIATPTSAAGWITWLKPLAQKALEVAAGTAGEKAIEAFMDLFNKKNKNEGKDVILSHDGVHNSNRLWTLKNADKLRPVQLNELLTTLKSLDRKYEQALRANIDGNERIYITNQSGQVFHGNYGSIVNVSGVSSSGTQSPVFGNVQGDVSLKYGTSVEEIAKLLEKGAKRDSDVRIVSVDITNGDDSLGNPVLDIKLRNIGDTVAFLKRFDLDIIGSATYEDCRQPAYSLAPVTAEYDLDITEKDRVTISQVIAPNDFDRFVVKLGRKNGGPTPTVYKAKATVIYDEDDKVAISNYFYFRLIGPVVPMGAAMRGVSKEAWDACVERNRKKFCEIDYVYYSDDPKDLCKKY